MSSVLATLPVPVLSLAVLVAGWVFYSQATVPPLAKLKIAPGIASLPPGPEKERILNVYPEDVYGPDGGYISLPYGRVKYALSGPKDGRKVISVPFLLRTIFLTDINVKVVLIHGFSMPSIMYKVSFHPSTFSIFSLY